MQRTLAGCVAVAAQPQALRRAPSACLPQVAGLRAVGRIAERPTEAIKHSQQQIGPSRAPSRHASRRAVVASAAAAKPPAPTPAPQEKSGLGHSLFLAGLFGIWYLANIYFNIYNKQVLKAFPYPLTITSLYFGVSSLIACLMWLLNLHEKPRGALAELPSITPLAMINTLGNALTNISLGSVAVSFTHTIKALEPFFSVLLSALFLGDKPSLPVMLTLFPIIGGVALASTSELSFTWKGFLSALGSNITFQSRNVLSKKFMNKGKSALDNINLFSVITMISFCLLTPIALFTDGLVPAQLLHNADLAVKVLISGICFHAYQQVSYNILQRVSPVTHSIGNCVKRVVVIVASVVVFQNPVTRQNAMGTAIALAGVFAYSQVKRLTGKKPKAATA